jgi:2-keto-4-pentenoate hydratase
VAWLANKLSEYDISLKKGEIILSGAFVKAQEVKIGDVFTAEMTGLGTVKTKFI